MVTKCDTSRDVSDLPTSFVAARFDVTVCAEMENL
jgi:hypothetical protein